MPILVIFGIIWLSAGCLAVMWHEHLWFTKFNDEAPASKGMLICMGILGLILVYLVDYKG